MWTNALVLRAHCVSAKRSSTFSRTRLRIATHGKVSTKLAPQLLKMGDGPGVLSLFTGAGGLDIGLERAGFETRLCIENDKLARTTIRLNRPRWSQADPGDANLVARDPEHAFRAAELRRSDIALIAGGPPCQPFSKAGHWTCNGPTRMRDPRARTIGAYLRIVSWVRPEVLLFENVLGFTFKGRHQGFRALLRGIREINRDRGTRYEPQLLQINAADYGVPQLRERAFVIAHRGGRSLRLPDPSHGPRSASSDRYRTAWDAIGDLDSPTWPDELTLMGKWAALVPSIPEGQNYLWHTPRKGGRPLFGWRTRYWSFLLKLAKSEPAWTLPAMPGPATGPLHWRNRLLSVEEMCRLQTFPRNYVIAGTRKDAQKQIGNAVPPSLAEMLGREIKDQLLGDRIASTRLTLIPAARRDCPAPESPTSVPRRFLALAGNHKPHPGTGRGPARRRLRKIPSTQNQGR
jgi:DNA (cytosine-5)-methyltransferase 1